jgi:FkbM family methyltransferase
LTSPSAFEALSLRRAIAPAVRKLVPHGVVVASDARRRYARRWPEVSRDPQTRQLIADSSLELVPDWIDLSQGTAVDVGANEGQWAAAFLTVVPHSSIDVIEPQPDMVRRLSQRFSDDIRVSIHGVAVGAASGVARMTVTHDRHLSSLRRPTESIVSAYHGCDWWHVDDQIDVQVEPLDKVVAGVDRISVMKIDVQGFEREVLAGGHHALLRTSAVLIELNFTTYYEGEASFAEIHQSLVEKGFGLTGLGNAGSLADGRLAWTDACYTPPRAR